MIKLIINRQINFSLTNLVIKKAIDKIANKEKKINKSIIINLVDDNVIKKINKQTRGQNKITDVLSFAWQEDKLVKSDFLGEIYISISQIKRQAKEYKVSLKEEFFRMLVHGILHLVGYDHLKEKEANIMFKKQENILKELI